MSLGGAGTTSRRRTLIVAPALLIVLLATGCGKSATSGSSSNTTVPAAPAVGAGATAQQSADLAQAQQDLTSLNGQLRQVDSDLDTNPNTEGDATP